MIRKALIALAAAALVATTAQAAGVNGAVASRDKLTTTVHPGSGHFVPAPPKTSKLKPIFDNIGFLYPKGYYFCCFGDTISGPDSQVGSTVWPAAEFTPAKDSTVKLINVAIGYVSGSNRVVINIAEDNGGVPGNVLGSFPVTGLGDFGDCCALAEAQANVHLTGGTPYWIFLSTDESSADTWAAWPFNSTDQTDTINVAGWDGSAWTAFGASRPAISFALYGKIKNN
jgi:hypothetical protein